MKANTKKITGLIILALLALVLTFALAKRVSPLSWDLHHAINRGVLSDEAINGYDPVAYFTKQKAVKGKKENSFQWRNATWYFSSQDHLNLFQANPEKYAPQFGGYCVFAASKGFTANSDPTVFKRMNEKLYLCAEQGLMDEWLGGGEKLLSETEARWK
jgi:YHS domain-containing protein